MQGKEDYIIFGGVPFVNRFYLSEYILNIFLNNLRWKQHEAYVQVLEAKYADLNCK